MKWTFLAAAALTFSGQALAQSTTCMDMGGGMMSCNSTSPQGNVHTQCMRHGAIVNCNSTGGGTVVDHRSASQDSGYLLGKGLSSLFQGIGERRFRANVGEMLASGDCQGAGAYALERGRLELGQEILRQCEAQAGQQRYAPPKNLPYEELVGMISDAADNLHVGFALTEGVVASEIEADGGTLRLGTNLSPDSNPVSVIRVVCEHRWMQSVLVRGGTIALNFVDPELRITRDDCGI